MPAAIGTDAVGNYFRFVGTPRHRADMDTRDGLTVEGHSLLSASLGYNNTNTAAITINGGTTFIYWLSLTLTVLSPRLLHLLKMFDYYVIRALNIYYRPVTGSTTSGSVAFGLTEEPEQQSDIAAPTQQQVMEMKVCAIGSYWSPKTLIYRNTGSEVWEARPDTPDKHVQLALAATSTTVGANLVGGQLYIEWSVDFLSPGMIDTNVTRKLNATGADTGKSVEGSDGSAPSSPTAKRGRGWEMLPLKQLPLKRSESKSPTSHSAAASVSDTKSAPSTSKSGKVKG
jgi:hypothetical protein